MVVLKIISAALCAMCVIVVGRTIKDDLNHLYTKNGRVVIGTMVGDLDFIRLGYNEGGNPNSLLEPYFGEMVTKVGRAYIDFPSCPAFHLALNLGQKRHLNAALLLLNLGANPNWYQLPESNPTQPMNPIYNRGFPPALLFALGFGQEPHNSHAALLERIVVSNPTAFSITVIDTWRAETGNPPLVHICILLNNLDGAHVLLKRFNISVHEADEHGITALHVAAWTGNIPAMIMLLHQGANASAVDAYGRTAMHYVAMRGHPLPAAQVLLASVDAAAVANTPKFQPPCAKKNDKCRVRLKRAMLSAQDSEGRTAYDISAAAPAKVELRDFLLSQHQLLQEGKPDGGQAASAGSSNSSSNSTSRDALAGTTRTRAANLTLAQRLAATGALALTMDSVDAVDLASSVLSMATLATTTTTNTGVLTSTTTATTTTTRFHRDYYSTQRPVLVSGQLTARAAIWAHVDREDFVARYGTLRLRTGPSVYPDVLKQLWGAIKGNNTQNERNDKKARSGHEHALSTVQEYLRLCFTAATRGGYEACRWPAHSPDASVQQPGEWTWDLPVPAMFHSICVVPPETAPVSDADAKSTYASVLGEVAPEGDFLIDLNDSDGDSDLDLGIAEGEGKQKEKNTPKEEENRGGGTATGNGHPQQPSTPRKWTRHGATEPLQLHLGPFATAVPFQAHNASWNLQLAGQKKWFMIPPGAEMGSIDEPAVGTDVGTSAGDGTTNTGGSGADAVERVLRAVATFREARVVVEVVQNPGEVVFVPHDWKYAVLHMTDSISVSQEFCTFLHTDARIQPLGTVLYGGVDPFRGIGLYKTHKMSKYDIGVTLPKTSKIPNFDFAPVT